MNNNIIFYDTCSLLFELENAFNSNEKFYISSITLNELENIKTSAYKDEEIKYNARKLLHLLEDNSNKYEVILYNQRSEKTLNQLNLPLTNDSKIIVNAIECYGQHKYKKDYQNNFIFKTQDLACKAIAKALGLPTQYISSTREESYTGCKEIILSDEGLVNFYQVFLPHNINDYGLVVNQYLIIKNEKGEIVDSYKWKDNMYNKINYSKLDTKAFGIVKAKDEYQKIVIDSLKTNQLTIIRGRAGSGKSLLGLAYLFQELENGRIDKIVMMVNPVATKDSCKFGFLPGTFLEKVLGSQIGHFLTSKLGGIDFVYQLIEQGQLEFIALADARGYDTTGMRCALYITEGQNTSVEQMKLILSRIGEDTIAVIEGDNAFQTDIKAYEGTNNGLKRACEVYKGEDYFGTVTLQNCYRSRIAAKIDDM